MKKLSLNAQTLLALISSLLFATVYVSAGIESESTLSKVKWLGTTFINALQIIAVPLVIFSIIVSINNAKDVTQLSRVGGFTFFLYIITTVFAVGLGLAIGTIGKPGKIFNSLVNTEALGGKTQDLPTDNNSNSEWIPNNFFQLLSDNTNLLPIVLLAIMFGIGLLGIAPRRRKFMLMFCEASQDIFVTIMGYIIRFSPLGIFGLIASHAVEIMQEVKGAENMLGGLVVYVCFVVLGLMIMILIIYPLLVKCFSKVGYFQFLKTIRPAQLFAFTTSSSTATLHKTTEQVGQLNVSERIRSFVLSLGATVNMDGTALYQGIAILFITQIFGHELGLGQQLYIVFYVTTSTMGVAGVPGASLITTNMLLYGLKQQGVMRESEIASAMALICFPDRFLDMCRTATNITGDAAVAVVVQSFENRRRAKKIAMAKKK